MVAKIHDINVLHIRGRLICSREVVYTRTVVRGHRHIQGSVFISKIYCILIYNVFKL